MSKGDMMLPVKTDKDIIRYLREALRIQEHNTHSMADKYCKIYKMYKAYRVSKRSWVKLINQDRKVFRSWSATGAGSRPKDQATRHKRQAASVKLQAWQDYIIRI